MQIDTQEILKFIKDEKVIIKTTKLMHDEKEGYISGLNAVESWIKTYEQQTGEEIAKELDK